MNVDPMAVPGSGSDRGAESGQAAETWAERAEALADQRRFEQAVQSYDSALALDASRADWWHQRGTQLMALRQYSLALASFDRALVLRPAEVASISARGVALEGLGRFADAVACYRRAIGLEPGYATAYSNLGRLLRDTGDVEQAVKYLREAVLQRPGFATAHNNLGCVLEDLGDLDAAIECYGRALALESGQPDFEYNLAIALLKNGQFARGLRAFEARLRTRIWRKIWPPSGIERWKGDALGDRTLVVVAEQGLGDTIQFCRYGAQLNALGIRPVLQVAPTLAALLESTGFFRDIVLPGTVFDAASHVWYPLMSLPLLFRTDADSIPSCKSYLRADAFKVQQWRRRLSGLEGLRVGICWQGGAGSEFGSLRGRSARVTEFADIAHMPGLSMISLQKGPAAEQLAVAGLRGQVFDRSDELETFADTAALVANLDLVITVDTAVAHLAGALGQVTWVALHHAADWRWFSDSGDSPWYPTMRLFRQSQAGNWQAVMASMRQQLAGLVAAKCSRCDQRQASDPPRSD